MWLRLASFDETLVHDGSYVSQCRYDNDYTDAHDFVSAALSSSAELWTRVVCLGHDVYSSSNPFIQSSGMPTI